MRVERFLQNSRRRFPEKPALVAGARRLTFAEVDAASDRFAAVLRSHGVTRGERVFIFTDNSWEAVVSIFAVLKAGAVFSPIHPSTKGDKLAYMLNNCQASAIIMLDTLSSVARAAMTEAPSVKLAVVIGAARESALTGSLSFEQALADESGPQLSDVVGIELDLAMLIYTSGSTGFPKGVMMTHQNIVAAATSITTYLESTSDDVILNALPLSFDYGLYQVLMSMLIGATVVLEKSFAFPQAILNRIAAEEVTGFPLVPTMAAILVQMKDLKPGAYPRLRYITNTGAALPPAHILRLQELFPHTRIYSMYGVTECKRCTYLPPEELAKHPASVGTAIPGTEAYVVDEAGRRVGPGVVGELVIRGPHLMKGYWGDAEATDRVLRPGPFPWERLLYTGDLFRADEDGFLYFIARRDDIIKTRGQKVSPKEIEHVLYALPGVREAAAIGVPDPVFGTAIKVVLVVCGADIHEQDVIRHCTRCLEDFMVPKHVEFRDALPRTDSGKINRRLIDAAVKEAA